MNHVMIDIEALGLTPGSAIVQIAAQAFDPATGELGSAIDIHIRPQAPFTLDPETLTWHAKGGSYPPAQGTLEIAPMLAIFQLKQWAKDLNQVEAWWAWGATYDFPLLAALFAAYHEPPPWHYWQARCARTVFNTLLPGAKSTPKPHDAAKDVAIQIRDLLTALSK